MIPDLQATITIKALNAIQSEKCKAANLAAYEVKASCSGRGKFGKAKQGDNVKKQSVVARVIEMLLDMAADTQGDEDIDNQV